MTKLKTAITLTAYAALLATGFCIGAGLMVWRWVRGNTQ